LKNLLINWVSFTENISVDFKAVNVLRYRLIFTVNDISRDFMQVALTQRIIITLSQ
jgi:hypothetical protein